MRKLIAIALIAFVPAVAAVAQEPQLNQRCELAGNWIGTNASGEATMLVTYTEITPSTGAIVAEYPIGSALLGFEPNIKLTSLRGVWERTGNNTFNATMIALAVDPLGNPVSILRYTSQDTVSQQCSLITVSAGKLAYFSPSQNPFTDSPVAGPINMANHEIYRMSVVTP